MRPNPTTVRVLLIALALFIAGRSLPGNDAWATEIQPLDLAAMVLTPDDLVIHGLTGYGNDYGEYLTTRDYAAGFARQQDMTFEDALDIFEAMGLLRGYTVRLALPGDPDDFYSDATEGLYVGIREYTSSATSGAMFDYARNQIENGDREVVESPKEFGDDWIFSRSDEDDPESGNPARELTLEFRVGHLHGMIRMFDVALDGEPSRPTEPDIDIVEQLGETLLERIETADSSDQPLLGNQAIRLTDEDGSVVTVGDRYSALDGSPIRRYAESDESLDIRADRMEEHGLVNLYGLEQDVRAGEGENPEDPHLTVRLFQFITDNAAADWLNDYAFDRFTEEGYADSMEPIALPLDLGDDAIAAEYTATYNGADLEGTVVWVLVNDTVARVTLDGAEPIDLDVIEEVVEAQVNCLFGSPCEPLEAPPELT